MPFVTPPAYPPLPLRREDLPDLGAIVRDRLANPAPAPPFVEDLPARLGAPIARQLVDQSPPGGHTAIRISNLGKCARALAYRALGVPPEGRKVDGRSVATFALGDTAESLMLAALDLALDVDPSYGWHVESTRTGSGQRRSVLFSAVDGLRYLLPIPGHADAVLASELAEGVRLGVESKSCSAYSYSKAEERAASHGEPFGPDDPYWWQIQGYAYALDVEWFGVLMLCKDSGAIFSSWVRRDPTFPARLAAHLGRVLLPNLLDTPDRDNRQMPARALPDGSTLHPAPATGALPWRCSYCSHWAPCWGEAVEQRTGRDWRGRPSSKLYLRTAPKPDDDAERPRTPAPGDLPK